MEKKALMNLGNIRPITQSKERYSNMENRYTELAKILAKNFISLAEVDLLTGNAIVLESRKDLELAGRELPWSELLDWYAKRRAYPEDRSKVFSLTQDYLNTFLDQGNEELVLEVRCLSENTSYMWVEINISVISAEERRLLVTTRSIDEDRMLKNIVEKFVYQDLDYFVLLNAKNDSYTMFSAKKSGTPIPPVFGESYSAQMLKFNARYVVPEELQRTTDNMQISHVLEMLEKEERYSFSTSGITDQGTFRRTRVQFQYYDKEAGLILLTRTDITRMFMEEQAKNERLAEALRDARQDALTGIYNQKGTEAQTINLLTKQTKKRAAFLFVDVDNFKMVNDTLGHQEGDTLLRFLAGSIRDIAAKYTGIAGRIGGDEFLLFLPDISSLAQVKKCAWQVCHAFDTLTEGAIKAVPISCSVGISIYPEDGADYKTLLRKADQALYTSKRYGKNRYYFYSEKSPLPE